MTFEDAVAALALAGRELGSGIAAAGPGVAGVSSEDLWAAGLRDEGAHYAIQLGIALGLLMADDPGAIKTLRELHVAWVTHHYE